MGVWCWKPARSKMLVDIQSRFPKVPIGEIDKPVWSISRFGSYVCSDTWNYLRQKNAIVNWWPLVWHQHAIPKQALILWLADNNRLTTSDRLLAWGYKGDTNCVFCRNGTESCDHLFFSCGFSS
jgi:hypothetical protein